MTLSLYIDCWCYTFMCVRHHLFQPIQMDDLVYYLTNFLFFVIPLLYQYINFSSLIICCLFSEGIYHFFLNFYRSSFCLWGSLWLSYSKFFLTTLAILLSIKSLVTSTVFRITFFDVAFLASAANLLARSRSFWVYF